MSWPIEAFPTVILARPRVGVYREGVCMSPSLWRGPRPWFCMKMTPQPENRASTEPSRCHLMLNEAYCVSGLALGLGRGADDGLIMRSGLGEWKTRTAEAPRRPLCGQSSRRASWRKRSMSCVLEGEGNWAGAGASEVC